MQLSISKLAVALMTFPLAIAAVVVPAEVALSQPTSPHDEVATIHDKRAQCKLELRWTDNWTDVCGRRYRVRGTTFGDGGNNWNTWEMTGAWVMGCRNLPSHGQDPAAWQDSNDPAIGYCDVCFMHGSSGHAAYLTWHENVANNWKTKYPDCYVDSGI